MGQDYRMNRMNKRNGMGQDYKMNRMGPLLSLMQGLRHPRMPCAQAARDTVVSLSSHRGTRTDPVIARTGAFDRAEAISNSKENPGKGIKDCFGPKRPRNDVHTPVIARTCALNRSEAISN